MTKMKCPTCGEPTRIIDTRTPQGWVRRVRTCGDGHKFTTYEVTSDFFTATAQLRELEADLKALRAVVDDALAKLETGRQLLIGDQNGETNV